MVASFHFIKWDPDTKFRFLPQEDPPPKYDQHWIKPNPACCLIYELVLMDNQRKAAARFKRSRNQYQRRLR